MNEKPKHNLVYLKPIRKHLRHHLTPAEAALWSLLKNSQLEGRKFRRQHSIDDFVVDFYCPEEHLVIELDGEVHNNPDQQDKDISRDKKLEEAGFKVLRFENKFVFEHREQMLNDIKACFKDKLKTTPSCEHPSFVRRGAETAYSFNAGVSSFPGKGKVPAGRKGFELF